MHGSCDQTVVAEMAVPVVSVSRRALAEGSSTAQWWLRLRRVAVQGSRDSSFGFGRGRSEAAGTLSRLARGHTRCS